MLLSTRQHPFAIGGAFIATMRLLIPILIVSWGIRGLAFGGILLMPIAGIPIRKWVLLMVFVGACAVLIRFAWRVLAWEFERVVITNEKVVHVHGVLNRKIASTPLVKIGDLTVSQPIVGRMLGYGALVVEGDTGDTPLHGLRYLPEPADTWRLVTQTARNQRAWEGGAKVSSGGVSELTPLAAIDAGPALKPDATHQSDVPNGDVKAVPQSPCDPDGSTTVIERIPDGS